MSANPGTSGRLHSEFIRIFLLQTHRETDRFFTVSGVWSRDVNFWVENTISKTTIPQSPTPPSFCVNEKVIGKREYGVDVWNRIIKCKFSFVWNRNRQIKTPETWKWLIQVLRNLKLVESDSSKSRETWKWLIQVLRDLKVTHQKNQPYPSPWRVRLRWRCSSKDRYTPIVLQVWKSLHKVCETLLHPPPLVPV